MVLICVILTLSLYINIHQVINYQHWVFIEDEPCKNVYFSSGIHAGCLCLYTMIPWLQGTPPPPRSLPACRTKFIAWCLRRPKRKMPTGSRILAPAVHETWFMRSPHLMPYSDTVGCQINCSSSLNIENQIFFPFVLRILLIVMFSPGSIGYLKFIRWNIKRIRFRDQKVFQLTLPRWSHICVPWVA